MTERQVSKRSWGSYGPAMRALPSSKWRAFVEFYLLATPGYGAQDLVEGPRQSIRRAWRIT
jgi:hypothetical protein